MRCTTRSGFLPRSAGHGNRYPQAAIAPRIPHSDSPDHAGARMCLRAASPSRQQPAPAGVAALAPCLALGALSFGLASFFEVAFSGATGAPGSATVATPVVAQVTVADCASKWIRLASSTAFSDAN